MKKKFWLLTSVDTALDGGGDDVAVVQDSPEPESDRPTMYSADELQAAIEAARSAEKNKLYGDLERVREELTTLKAAQDAEAAEKKAAQDAAAAEEKRKLEEQMELRDLLAAKEQEWAAQLEAERADRERAIALLEQERRYAEVQNYRAQRISEVQDEILPELIDLIGGDTADEIDASVEAYRERSARILSSMQQAAESARRDMSGARVTAPSAGPLENYTDSRTYTPDQLRDMSMNEYSQHRAALLGDATRATGLFG